MLLFFVQNRPHRIQEINQLIRLIHASLGPGLHGMFDLTIDGVSTGNDNLFTVFSTVLLTISPRDP